MQHPVPRISAKNQVTIPVAVLEEAGLRAGDQSLPLALGVATHQPSEAIGVASARLRGAHPISLPDANSLATARSADAEIASFDEKVLRAARLEGIATAAASGGRPRQH